MAALEPGRWAPMWRCRVPQQLLPEGPPWLHTQRPCRRYSLRHAVKHRCGGCCRTCLPLAHLIKFASLPLQAQDDSAEEEESGSKDVRAGWGRHSCMCYERCLGTPNLAWRHLYMRRPPCWKAPHPLVCILLSCASNVGCIDQAS